MQSEGRRILHTTFDKIEVGQQFQLVNTVMGAAIVHSHYFQKIDDPEYNAIQLDNQMKVRIRPYAKIETLPLKS